MDRKSPAGLFGRYYAAKHDYGQYRSCAITATYQISEALSNHHTLIEVLQQALAKTIDRRPELCYGIISKSQEEDAHLYRLPKLEWDDIVEVQNTDESHGDSGLTEALGRAHDCLFSDQHTKPAWKLLVRLHEAQPNCPRKLDIGYFSHHVISDGSSCLAFHKIFQECIVDMINGSTDSSPRWPYHIRNDISRPLFLEDAFPLTKFLAHSPTETHVEHVLDPWTADPPSLSSIDSFITRILSVDIPAAQVSNILTDCRQRSITITGLVHALILLYLSKAVPQAQTFRAQTPMSMRAFTKTSKDAIVNHISAITQDWTPEYISIFRRCDESSQEETDNITAIASHFAEQVRAELREVPVNGPAAVLSIARLADFGRSCEESMKVTKRSHTYELSNIGAMKAHNAPAQEDKHEIHLEELLFTQSAMVTGPAVGVNIVSIAEGTLSLSLIWQEGIVDADLMLGMRNFLHGRLLMIGQ